MFDSIFTSEDRSRIIELNPGLEAGKLILKAVGEDLKREGIVKTPERFSRALKDLTAGYQTSPQEVVGTGVFAAEGNGLVSVKDIEFYSLCEHHMLPFWGKISVAYYPAEKIIGLSKIPRIVDVFAKRLQVQERLTRQVVDSLQEILAPRAVAAKAEACHLCVMMRGVEKQGSATVTEYSVGMENLSELEKSRIWNSL